MAPRAYKLLAINDGDRSLSRRGNDDVFVIDIDYGGGDARGRLKLELTKLLQAGSTFRNAVFTTHGNEGFIFFGKDIYIDWHEWYAGFYHAGYEQLFPFPHTEIYFAGCDVAGGEYGWRFLEAAARTFCRLRGGWAVGWTSLRLGVPSWFPWIGGHVEHVTGDTRAVSVTDDGYLNFYENFEKVAPPDHVLKRAG